MTDWGSQSGSPVSFVKTRARIKYDFSENAGKVVSIWQPCDHFE